MPPILFLSQKRDYSCFTYKITIFDMLYLEGFENTQEDANRPAQGREARKQRIADGTAHENDFSAALSRPFTMH
jgi:hypothetical protein